MKKAILLSFGLLVIFSLNQSALAGPKGVIIVRPLGNDTSLTIDGDFSDWPLERYENPSVQPLFPDGQESESTDALGDYVIYAPDRVGFFNTARGAVSEDDDNVDFEVNTYFAYDSEFLYILAIFIDDEFEDTLDESGFGSMPYLNDGLEFFFDSNNDSNDCISSIQFPAIDGEEPNLDDFQVGTALNFFFDPVIPADEGGLGARQGIIRSGNLDLLGSGDFSDGTYQDALAAIGSPDIAAKWYDDLRAANAPNPAIAENAGMSFTGYAMEMKIPFGVVNGFTPEGKMGFTLFWRDVDQSSGGSIQFIDWAQSTTAGGCASEDTQLTDIFYAPNWGALEFNTDNPLSDTHIRDWSLR